MSGQRIKNPPGPATRTGMCVSTTTETDMDDNHPEPTKQDKPHWTRIDDAVLPVLAEIGQAAIGVYVALKSHADSDGVCWPSLEAIAQLSGASKRTCIRCLAGMMQRGLITREVRNRGTGRAPNLYRFPDSPSATVAPGVIAQVPKVTTPSAKSEGSPSATVALEVYPVLKKPHKKKPQPRESAGVVDPPLLVLIEQLNALPPGILPSRIKTDPVPPKIVTRYRSALKKPELREALSDPDKIVAALRKASFAHGKQWASLLGLLSTNKAGEYKLTCLLNGAYASNGNHKQQRVSDDRFYHDPDRPIASSL